MPKAKVVARLSEIQVELRGGIQDGGIQVGGILVKNPFDPPDAQSIESLEVTVQTFDILLGDIKAYVEQSEERQGEGEDQQSAEAVASDQSSGKALSSRQNSSESHHDLKDRIAGFESSHPRITSFLTEVTELLASIGI